MRLSIVILLLFYSRYSNADELIPDLKVEQIADGVFLHQSFSLVYGFGLVSANGLVVVDDETAFIVDTPWSLHDTETLVTWVKENNFELLGTVSTHSHKDRTAGIDWLNSQSIPTYATALTNDLLKKEQQVQAMHSLTSTVSLLANDQIEVFYPGAGHTKDNVVVWLPESNILFGGCLIRSLKSEGLGYTGAAYIKQWLNSTNNVLARYPDAKMVVPGHGDIGGMELLDHTMQLAQMVLD